MHFSTNLWDKLPHVDKRSIDRRKVGEDFIALLKERMVKEETYSKEMEKLAAHPFFMHSFGAFGSTVAAMKNSFMTRSMQVKIQAE